MLISMNPVSVPAPCTGVRPTDPIAIKRVVLAVAKILSGFTYDPFDSQLPKCNSIGQASNYPTNCGSSSDLGMDGCAPILVAEKAPARLANCTASSNDSPLARA